MFRLHILVKISDLYAKVIAVGICRSQELCDMNDFEQSQFNYDSSRPRHFSCENTDRFI